MPYFDRQTYIVSDLMRDQNIVRLRWIADEFVEKMRLDPEYFPPEFLDVAEDCLAHGNLNEVAILADSTTVYRLHMQSAFLEELYYAHSRGSLKRLLYLAYPAYYTDIDGTHPNKMGIELAFAINKLAEMGGDAEVQALNDFFHKIQERNRREWFRSVQQRAEADEMLRQKEAALKAAQAERKANKLAASKAKQDAMHERQIAGSWARLIALGHFNHLPLEEKLHIIASDGKRYPAFYGLDFDQIPEDELRKVPDGVLEEVLCSYKQYNDPKWKRLKMRIEGILEQ